MRMHKLKYGCALCQLLYDFSKTCAHYNISSPKPPQEELSQMLAETGPEKGAMFVRLFQSLDILSTYKITSLLITREHFKEVIVMFITKETSDLLLPQIGEVEV